MPPILHAHPFSSYCQKVLIALYENDTPFEYRMLDSAERLQALERLWPLRRFPILVDGDRTIIEATTIIEYLGLCHPGAVELVPGDPHRALDVRMMDRFFDNYISTPTQTIVLERLRPDDARDPHGVARAHAMFETAYAWLDAIMADREWAAAGAFSLADCAAAPALFYADWTHPLGDRYPNVTAYRDRLLARPSFARAVDQARPYRSLFPLGAPDRD